MNQLISSLWQNTNNEKLTIPASGRKNTSAYCIDRQMIGHRSENLAGG